jgi:predicted ATPase
MSRIKINNFGPIRKGFVEDDGWLDINKVTVFIGNQGSGKSTVAKLISIFSWLEKNIVRNSISIDKLNTDIFSNLCIQQEMLEYFASDTYISF